MTSYHTNQIIDLQYMRRWRIMLEYAQVLLVQQCLDRGQMPKYRRDVQSQEPIRWKSIVVGTSIIDSGGDETTPGS